MDNEQTIDPDRARELFLAAAHPTVEKIAQAIEGTPKDVMVVVAAALMSVFVDHLVKDHESVGFTSRQSESTIHALTLFGLELAREIDVNVDATRRSFDGKLRVVRSDESTTTTFDLGDDA
jgi:uncharacterized protein with PhoU and TrkA domain